MHICISERCQPRYYKKRTSFGRKVYISAFLHKTLDFLQKLRLSAKTLDFLAKGLWEVASAKGQWPPLDFYKNSAAAQHFCKSPRLSAKTSTFCKNPRLSGQWFMGGGLCKKTVAAGRFLQKTVPPLSISAKALDFLQKA